VNREIWLDYIRAFACALVTLGHLANSFIDAQIVTDTGFLSAFVQIIYHFHVYIFFFCSGYLFQAHSHQVDNKTIWRKKAARSLDFAVPYVVFSFITYAIKVMLGSNVNTPVEESFFSTLLNHPINQMWYLDAALFITILTPIIRTKKTMILVLLVSVVGKAVSMIPTLRVHRLVGYLLQNEIWYVLGMIFYIKKSAVKDVYLTALAIPFWILCYAELIFGVSYPLGDFLMTLTGIMASVGFFRMLSCKHPKKSAACYYISRYMLQIYLLHTICAAGIRIVLMKLGVTSILPHVLFGLVFSFAVPLFAAYIAEKTVYLNFFFFPSKTWKVLCAKKH